LPIELEDQLTSHVTAFTGEAARALIASPEAATEALQRLARDAKYKAGAGGPTKVGEAGYDPTVLGLICAAYLDAFAKRRPVYPYFTSGR
jgi:predicted Zn-dependent protease